MLSSLSANQQGTLEDSDFIKRLESADSITFNEIEKLIGNIPVNEFQILLDDLIYNEDISENRKAMSFQVLYLSYRDELSHGDKNIECGLHILMLYFSKLSSATKGSIAITHQRVYAIMYTKHPISYKKGDVEKILVNNPFDMDGLEIDKICNTLGIE